MPRGFRVVVLCLAGAGLAYGLQGTGVAERMIGLGSDLIRAASPQSVNAPPVRAHTVLAGEQARRSDSISPASTATATTSGDSVALDRLRFGIPGSMRSVPAVAPATEEVPAASPQSSFIVASDEAAPPRPAAIVVAEAGRAGQPAPAGVAASPANETDDPQRRLARSIQTELARVGCYAGTIDGDWGNDTRRAMKAFNDRVNASLPVTKPDYILLTLLQGHRTKACGAVCPTGQAVADDGTCQARSVIAEARRQSTVPATQALAPDQAVEQAPPSAAAVARSEADAAERAQRKAAAERALADAERARLEAVTAARRKAVADKAAAEAEQEKARAEAERQRILAAEDRKRQLMAESERARAAEARRREEAAAVAEASKARAAAEAQKRQEIAAAAERARAAEAQRLRLAEEEKRRQAEARSEAEAQRARLAEEAKRKQIEAEKARIAADVRRREELAALIARTAEPAASPSSAPAAASVAVPAPPAFPATAPSLPAAVVTAPSSHAEPASAAGSVIAASPVTVVPPDKTAPKHVGKAIAKPADARFVGRFVPPPTYRVGRLPPSQPLYFRAAPASSRGPLVGRGVGLPSIFKSMDRHSP